MNKDDKESTIKKSKEKAEIKSNSKSSSKSSSKSTDTTLNQNNHKIVVISVTLAVVLLLGALGVFVYGQYQTQQALNEKANLEETVTDTSDIPRYEDYTTITYDGVVYQYNTDIKTVLFLGIDQLDGSEEISGSAGRSDTMILLILNSAEETVTMLSISRDTIAEIDVTNSYGETVMTAETHLALQYSFGDGGKTSCVLSREAVSRLLYDIPIDYYMSLNLDGINGIIDGLGGLTMTLEEDYTYIDESLIKGETVTMDGALAESFVRYRDITELGSNDDRMLRQEQFIEAFFNQLKSKVSGDTSSMEAVWNLVSSHLTTDLSYDVIEKLASYEMSDESYKVPGETVEGEFHDEYIVDEKDLQKTLVELLYKVK